MALVYRGIWQDSGYGDELCEKTADVFASWVAGKWPTLAIPAGSGMTGGAGTRWGKSADLEYTAASASQPEAGIVDACRNDLVESWEDGSRWHTTLRAWRHTDDDTSVSNWIWVDVEAVGGDASQLDPVAPGFVDDLLNAGGAASVDGDKLLPAESNVCGFQRGDELAELISRADRTLPIIVINDNAKVRGEAQQHGVDFPDIVDTVRRTTAGIAAVYTVDNSAADGMIAGLGRSHGVWDGAMRIYLPEVDPATPGNAWRHRYFTAIRYARSRNVARRAVGRLLGPVSAVRRPPPSYPIVKTLLERGAIEGDFEALLAMADADLKEADQTIADLREVVRQRDESMDGLALDLAIAAEEQADLVERLAELDRHVKSLQSQLTLADDFYSSGGVERPIPTTVNSSSEAAELAVALLADRLVIPQAALRDLEDLDAAPTAVAWGQTAWKGLRALHAYAEDRAKGWANGGFWEWCQTSGNIRAWPATDKKLAMSESESVNKSRRLRALREFPVSTDVDSSGRLYMQAHLKIAEGGGNLAPRIYFHCDDGRGLVHVGFFGPHRLLPNTKS